MLTDLGRKTIEEAAPKHVASVRAHMIDLLTPDELAGAGRAQQPDRDAAERRMRRGSRGDRRLAALLTHAGTELAHRRVVGQPEPPLGVDADVQADPFAGLDQRLVDRLARRLEQHRTGAVENRRAVGGLVQRRAPAPAAPVRARDPDRSRRCAAMRARSTPSTTAPARSSTAQASPTARPRCSASSACRS